MRKIYRRVTAVWKVEVVAIGNEVLEGFTINTNGARISQRLLQEGYVIDRHIAFPDDPDTLFEAYASLPDKERIVIATGGLGPTGDDKTHQFLEKLAASSPFETLVIPNPVGSAEGVCLKGKNSCFIALPGVPFEMMAMMPWVIDFLQRYYPSHHHLDHGWVHLMRTSETKVDPLIQELLQKHPDLSYGIYPSQGYLGVHFFADQGSDSLQIALKAVKDAFPDRVIDSPSGKFEEALYLKCKALGLTLATAESCTGGTVAAKIVSVPDSSCYFLGGIVSYSNEMKEKLLGVDPQLIAQEGAVSEGVAKAMAEGVRKVTGADYGIAISGIAGPSGGTSEKPVGTVWYAIASPKETKAWLRNISGSRDLVIERGANYLLSELLLELDQSGRER